MKAYYLIAPLGAALLVGCAYEPVYHTTAPAPIAYVAPPATYVAPPSTVVLGAGPVDSDGDGYANTVDRWPSDARWLRASRTGGGNARADSRCAPRRHPRLLRLPDWPALTRRPHER